MFAKVFTQIFDSSIAEDPQLRLTFIDLLLLCDPNGVVDMTQEAIARRTNRPTELIREHLVRLSSPDPRSRTPDHDGRRIALLDDHRDWGWVIVNYERFRMVESVEQRREKTRERTRVWREKTQAKAQKVSFGDASVTLCDAGDGKQKQKQKQKEKQMQKQMQLTTDVNNSPLAALAESVYSVYPKKVGRGAALKAIEKAILKVERVEKCQEGDAAAFLRSKAEEYARARESADPKYTPHAATWFNQERYLDDPAEWSPKSNSRVREQNERPETINVPIV